MGAGNPPRDGEVGRGRSPRDGGGGRLAMTVAASPLHHSPKGASGPPPRERGGF